MKIKILSWNVRGANVGKVIKAFIKMQRVDIVCLQGTKISEVSQGLIRSSGVGRFLERASLRAKGATGGIIIFWDSCCFSCLTRRKASSQFLVDSNS